MSGSGITPVNSGPLIIRTYLDNSPNNTYLLGKYDYPISSNRVLLTSTNGLLIESDNIQLSSLTVSSLTGTNIIASTIDIQTLYGSSIFASTFLATVSAFSNMTGSSFQAPAMTVTGLLTISTLSTPAMTCSTMTGNPSSIITMSTVIVKDILHAATMRLDHAIFSTMYGENAFVTMLSTNVISSNTMSSNVLSITSFIRSTFDCGSTYLSTNSISSLIFVGSSLRTDIITVNSTIYGSTLVLAEIKYAQQQYGDLPSTVYTININGSTLNGANIVGNTIYYSTMTASSITVPQTNVSTATFITVTGSTLVVSSLIVPRVVVSTMIGNVLSYSTMNTSTINLSTMTASSIFVSYGTSVSSLYASSMNGITQNVSNLLASTLYVSTMIGRTVSFQQMSSSTVYTSSMFASFATYSSTTGNTFFATQSHVSSCVISTTYSQFMSASTISASTLFANSCYASTMLLSVGYGGLMTISSMIGSTCNILNGTITSLSTQTIVTNTTTISTMNIPVINNIPLYGTSGSIATLSASSINSITIGSGNTITNTFVGYGNSTLVNNTSGVNNTAMGFAALNANTTGSYNTAFGTLTMFTNTTGSYNTAIGAKAGIFTGFNGSYNTYIGYGAIPSQSDVINEIVIGGSSTAAGTNSGNGSNSVTIGNSAITKTIIYKNLGIGTTTPGSALDIRGSYQQIGGNLFIYNSSAAYVYVWLYSDVASGCGWFLNSSTRITDGGQKTATLRNDYGSLRLQSFGGNTNVSNGITILATSGYVGFNSSSPSHTVDVGGSVNVTGSTTVSNIVCSGQFKSNGVSIGTSFITQWTVNPGGTIAYSSGNVGIGTASPGTIRLYVDGSVHFTGNLIINGTITTTNSNNTTVSCGLINTQGNTFTTGSGSINTNSIVCGTINTNNGVFSAKGITCKTINGAPSFYSNKEKIQWYSDINFQFRPYIGAPIITPITIHTSPPIASGIYSPGALMIHWTASGNTHIQTIDGLFQVTGYTAAILRPGISYWQFPSDRRIKRNIQPLDSVLSLLLQLNVVTYHLKMDKTRTPHVGLIAQEVEPIFPHVVQKDTSGRLEILYSVFITYYIKAFQEQHQIIQQQEQDYIQYTIDINELESTINTLNQQELDIIEQIKKQEKEIQFLEQEIYALLSI